MSWPDDLPRPTAYRIRPVDDLEEDGEPLDALFCHEQMLVYIHTPVIKLYLDRMLDDLAMVSQPDDCPPRTVKPRIVKG